jgi:hypothetical protein
MASGAPPVAWEVTKPSRVAHPKPAIIVERYNPPANGNETQITK